MRRGLILAALVLAAGLARGETAVADLAPGQLRQAELLLRQAKEALAQRDYALARQLASQAGLDARLAYAMTESVFLRRDAIAVHEESARLRWLASTPAAVSR
jgi:hypothetical protein